jgi:Methyltransferase domain
LLLSGCIQQFTQSSLALSIQTLWIPLVSFTMSAQPEDIHAEAPTTLAAETPVTETVTPAKAIMEQHTATDTANSHEKPETAEKLPTEEPVASESAAESDVPSSSLDTHDDDEPDQQGYIESLQVDSASEGTADRDSTLGDDIPNSTTASLNSSVTKFRDYAGRRYHAFENSHYWLPNDDEEMGRLDLQHFVWKISLNGKSHLAPISKDIHRAMDAGTGTGKWAIEFADEHPSCEVIGVDLSPIQPTAVPNNCSFLVDNIEEPWVYAEPFDYIHGRMLGLGTFCVC